MINGLRLKQVRELKGLTQSQLALDLGVNQSTVAYIEGGFSQPSEALLTRICEQTEFPREFFERMEVIDFPLGSLLYRSRTTLDAIDKAKANRYGQFIFEIVEHLSTHLKIKHFHHSRAKTDPIMAARFTRSQLGISLDKPINHLIYDLERSGVLIFNTPESIDKIDAYSAWAGSDEKKPVIVLTNDTNGERRRWSTAHELGHLVMHSMIFGDIHEFEREADKFAAELLMPEDVVRESVFEPFTLYDAIKLKNYWKVSTQALLKRAFELEIINERQYKNLIVQLSRLKSKLQGLNPGDELIEKPRTLRSMAETVYGKKSGGRTIINYNQFSWDTQFPVFFLKEVIEAQATQEEYTGKKSNTGSSKIVEFPVAMQYQVTDEISDEEMSK